MKLYSSFLLRCWVLQEDDEKIVFDIEHIQKGERLRAVNADEALQWILQTTKNFQPAEHELDTEEIESPVLPNPKPNEEQS